MTVDVSGRRSLAGWQAWLDDLLDVCAARAGWISFRGGGAATELLGTGRVVELSLGDDLGDDESQGWGSASSTIAQQVVEARLWPRDGIPIHSVDAAGRD